MFLKKNQLQLNTAEEKESGEEKKRNLLSLLLLKRGIGLGVALAVLVVLIIAGTVAWYTRIANVTGITMKAAEFDFAANYTDSDFVVNVSDYMSAGRGVAPGTGGMIPIRLSTTSSVDINYAVNLDISGTAPEFQQRIRLYYYTQNGGVYTKHYIQPGSPDIVGFLPAKAAGATESVGYEFIYWEWLYDFDPSCYFDTRLALHKYDASLPSASGMTYTADSDAGVAGSDGRYAYQKAMEIKLEMSGVQATPVSNEQYAQDVAAGHNAAGSTVFKPTA